MGLAIGLITGYLICIPMGPLGLCIFSTTLKEGTLAALTVAIGGSLMDFAYFFTILTGLNFFHPPEFVLKAFPILGTIFIFFLGFKDLFFPPVVSHAPKKFPKLTTRKFIGYFLLGIFIYGSNPTLILTMTAIGAFLKSWSFFPQNETGALMTAIGLGLGSFAWFVTLICLVKKFRLKLGSDLMTKLYRLSGLGLIIMGGYLLVQIYPQFSE